MKIFRPLRLSWILLLLSNFSFSQQKVPYGSNNGKTISILNTLIYYEEYGAGIPLILLHGGMGSIADFASVIPILAQHFHVFVADAPGEGRSSYPDTMTYEILADYSLGLINQLQLDSVYLLGWSDGGNAALILAAARPDKIKKVMTSGANYLRSGYQFGDSNALKLFPANYQPSAGEQQWIDSYFKTNKNQWKKIMNDRLRMWGKEVYFSPDILKRISVPVLLVIGDRDAVILEHGIDMHRLIKNSQFCVLPQTTHAVFSENPALISEIAIHFFTN